MEQCVLVPVSMYNNKSLKTRSFRKQELPKNQADYNPTYPSDFLEKEYNNKLFARAHSLVDRNLSCPRMKLPNSQNLILESVETGVFLSDFAQQLRMKIAEFPDIYFTLLDAAGASPTPLLNQNDKIKREDAWSLSKHEPQKLQNLSIQGTAAYGSVPNLSKATNLPVSNVRQFLRSRLRTHNLIWPHENAREWRLLQAQ